ncbi:hypothetical protein Q5752_002171 [Cryptotrichosporon argae]
MSYAAIASHNIPEGEMPKPNQDLLDGHFAGETEAHPTVDIEDKINVLPAGADVHHPKVDNTPSPAPEPIRLDPAPVDSTPTGLSVAPEPLPVPTKASISLPESGSEFERKKAAAEKEVKKEAKKVEEKGKKYEKKAKEEIHKAESAIAPYWEKSKDVVLRPGTLGGLLGVVNVGLLSTIGYYAYTNRDRPWDRRIVAGAVAGTLALFGGEGYLAESYLSTPEGKQEAERAKNEGSKLYLQAKEIVLRPGVAGGLAGALNVAVLSTVGYFSYKHWNQPWDRRVVSAVSVGLLGLSGLEGWAGKVYKDTELPKH